MLWLEGLCRVGSFNVEFPGSCLEVHSNAIRRLYAFISNDISRLSPTLSMETSPICLPLPNHNPFHPTPPAQSLPASHQHHFPCTRQHKWVSKHFHFQRAVIRHRLVYFVQCIPRNTMRSMHPFPKGRTNSFIPARTSAVFHALCGGLGGLLCLGAAQLLGGRGLDGLAGLADGRGAGDGVLAEVGAVVALGGGVYDGGVDPGDY